MARKPSADSAQARFAALLAQHLSKGSRPATATGEPWTYAEFAAEVQSSRENEFVSPRTISNWCKGCSLPAEITPIFRALFGPTDRHTEARDELRDAFLAARAAKHAAATRRTKPDSAGTRWVSEGGEFIRDRTSHPNDKDAAAKPLQQQLQAAVSSMAAELADSAQRLRNTLTWAPLPETAARFKNVIDCDPSEMPLRLGDAYVLLLRLGRFLETDVRVRRDTAAVDSPLDPDIQGSLTDLIRVAAPWLRGFPTIADWDDAAGRALVRADLFQPAREFTRVAREQQAISEREIDETELFFAAADTSDYLGQNVSNRAIADAKNLMLAAARVVAAYGIRSKSTDFVSMPLGKSNEIHDRTSYRTGERDLLHLHT